jgi:mono/diheme cytochrome c family protein
MGDERSTSTRADVRQLLALVFIATICACTHAGSAVSAQASAATVAANNPASSSDGAAVYLTNCSSCHGVDGRGLEGMFPPLAHNADVTGDPRRVISIVENGSQARLVVNGATYIGDMPEWRGHIGDDQIAAVVTYIRSAWGNRASGVTFEQVNAGLPFRHVVR